MSFDKIQQMIAVFITALMLEVFTVYFIIKALAMDLPIGLVVSFDFAIWNLFLSLPTIVAIYAGSTALSKAQSLCSYVGKYANFSNDEICSLKVRRKKKRLS